jgi:hypothetical protein
MLAPDKASHLAPERRLGDLIAGRSLLERKLERSGMELLEGESLRERLEREGRVPATTAAVLISSARYRATHVLPELLDFGIAKSWPAAPLSLISSASAVLTSVSTIRHTRPRAGAGARWAEAGAAPAVAPSVVASSAIGHLSPAAGTTRPVASADVTLSATETGQHLSKNDTEFGF